MGFRFRNSKKIAPGIKINLGKRSAGVTFGTRGAHYTINSSGRRTTSVGVPGTGISYSTSSGGSGGRKRSSSSSRHTASSSKQSNNPDQKKNGSCLIYFIALLLIFAAIKIFSYAWIPAIILLIVVPFVKVDKKSKIISFITILILGFISFLTFGWLQTGQTIDNTNEVNKLLETEIQTEKVIQDITGAEQNTEKSTELQAQTELPVETELQTESFVPEYYYSTDTVNVRTSPSTDSEVIGMLNKSDRIQVEAIEGEWASVLYNGTAAYVSAQYLSKLEPETKPQEKMVWIPQSGTKYHTKSDCSGMIDGKEVTVSEAIQLGYEPCKKC